MRLLGVDPAPCFCSAWKRAILVAKCPVWGRGVLSLLTCVLPARCLSGEMTSRCPLRLPSPGGGQPTLTLAPGVGAAYNKWTDGSRVRLMPKRRRMIYCILIYVNLLT